MKVIIHKNIDKLEEIIPDMENLIKKYHEVTIFQDIDWFKHCLKSNKTHEKITPYIVEITEGNETIGVIPMYLSHREIMNVRFCILKPIGMGSSNYLLPILSKKYNPAKILKVAFGKIYEDKHSWDCIHWENLPSGSNMDLYLENEKNISVNRRWLGYSPRVELNRDIEAVKSGLSKSFIRGILYKERKLKRKGELRYHVVTEEQDIEPIMNKLFDFHCKRWESSSFKSRYQRELLMSLVKSYFLKGLLHLSYLRHNETIVAVELGMIERKTRYVLIRSMNLDFHKYSVGLIIIYKMIEEACAKGYKVLDFLCGDEDYKQKCSTINKINLEYYIFNKSKRSLLYKQITNSYNSNFSSEFSQYSVPRQMFVKSIIRGSAYFFASKDKLTQKILFENS